MVDDVRSELEKFRDPQLYSSPNPANPFKLASSLEEPASDSEIDGAWPSAPAELREAWRTSRECRLFEDVEYGQWGLLLLSPASSFQRTTEERERRPSDLLGTDIVLGEFLGDQELAVMALAPDGSRPILIALPLDAREDWYVAAPSLAEFLKAYREAIGEKYWEMR